MTPLLPQDAPRLHAYLDGELASVDRDIFETRLAADPALAATLKAEQQFRVGLRQRVSQVRAPLSLRARVEAALAQPAAAPSRWQRLSGWWLTPRPMRPVMALVYTLIWLAVLAGVMGGLGQVASPEPATLVELADTHAIYFERGPALDVTGPPQKISDWFQGRVSFAVDIPTVADWQLVGARLGEFHQAATAHLLYQRPTGQRLSVTLFTPRPSDFPAQAEVRQDGQTYFVGDNGQHRTVLWRSGQVGYALIADVELPAENLLNLAADVRQQLP